MDNYRSMFESRISAGAVENYQKQEPHRNLMPKQYLDGPMTWKVMQRNAWKDIANWRTEQFNNKTKSRHNAWMTINLKEENESIRELSTVCSQIVLKCLVCVWLVFGDLIFCGL